MNAFAGGEIPARRTSRMVWWWRFCVAGNTVGAVWAVTEARWQPLMWAAVAANAAGAVWFVVWRWRRPQDWGGTVWHRMPAATVCSPAGGRPEGVAIHHPDGSVTPCELAYAGRDVEGLDVWEVATEFRPGIDRVAVARLPARSCIHVPIHHEEGTQ